jgi:hypothetical protein
MFFFGAFRLARSPSGFPLIVLGGSLRSPPPGYPLQSLTRNNSYPFDFLEIVSWYYFIPENM